MILLLFIKEAVNQFWSFMPQWDLISQVLNVTFVTELIDVCLL